MTIFVRSTEDEDIERTSETKFDMEISIDINNLYQSKINIKIEKLQRLFMVKV